MDALCPYDIREIRPDEAAAALAMVDGGPVAQDLRRQLSVGAFATDDGALLGVAVHETLSTRGCVVHLHSESPEVGRALLDRALQKAAAAGRRSSQVALHPQATAEAVWNISSWPARPAAAQDEIPQAAEPETADVVQDPAEPAVDPADDSAASAEAQAPVQEASTTVAA